MIMFFLQLSLLFFCNYDIILKFIFFLRIASAKSWNVEGSISLVTLMDSCLTIDHMCGSPCLWDKFSPCVLWPLMIIDWANSGSVDYFFIWWVNFYLIKGSWCYSREWVWNLRTKLCYIASGKWNVSRFSLCKSLLFSVIYTSHLKKVYKMMICKFLMWYQVCYKVQSVNITTLLTKTQDLNINKINTQINMK